MTAYTSATLIVESCTGAKQPNGLPDGHLGRWWDAAAETTSWCMWTRTADACAVRSFVHYIAACAPTRRAALHWLSSDKPVQAGVCLWRYLLPLFMMLT